MTKYKRNAEAVLSQLVENNSGQVVCKTDCRIQIPTRFSETAVGLAEIGINTYTYGMFAIIRNDTNEYAVCNIAALVELNPFKVSLVTIDEVDYHEFYFEAGQVVIENTSLVKRDLLMYNIMDEIIFKGKIPWYMDYEDLGKMFDTAKYHANSNVGQNLETIEFITSMVTRSKQDRSKYIRAVGNSFKDFSLDKIEYVPLKSVFYSVNSTVNKLIGSYFTDGVTSALVKKTDKVQKIESILRA